MSANTASRKITLSLVEPAGKVFENLRYASESPAFMPVADFTNGIVRPKALFERFHDCREIIIGEFRSILAEKKEAEGNKFQGFSRLYYIIGFSKRNQKQYECIRTVSLRIAHTFDRILKCRPTHLFPISSVTSTGKPSKVQGLLYLVEADKPWVKAPEMMSLHMLLMRLGIYNELRSVKNVPLDKLPKALQKTAGKIVTHDLMDDLARAAIHVDAWIKVLREYHKRFGVKKFTTTYQLDKSDADDGVMYEDGIDSLAEEIAGNSVEDYLEEIENKYYEEEESNSWR